MAKSQNSKFKCFSGIPRSLLYIGNLPTLPSDPTTDIPTNTTTFENPKKNFKTEVRTPGVVARLMGLDLLPDPRKVFRRKEDQKGKLHVDGRPPNVIAKLMGLDGLPPQQPLHRQHKGFSETYRQWTASVSSQRDGKPYEHRSNRKDSTAQQECKDEHDVLETSKVERSSYPAKRTINSKLSEAEMAFIQQKFMADHGGSSFKAILQVYPNCVRGQWTFGQVLECLDNENLERLAMMERLLGPLPQHMIISTNLRAEKYFKRSARLDWLEGAISKESTRAVCKGFVETYRQWTASLLSQTDRKPYEHRSNRKDSMAQQECKDEYKGLETSKVERSSYPAKRTINSKLSEAEMTFIQ
ncbi:unnamed protein product [Camellia sinensis]